MNGLILLDKPAGITSYGAAAAIKRIYGIKRVGHTGTLDPMATGVLPILIGKSTRLCGLVSDADKRYTATAKLGITTDTLDITGTVTSKCENHASEDQFVAALEKFKGDILQIPPMYSAIKKDGVRLYDLARKGIEIKREARPVTIKQLNYCGSLGENEYKIDILCSKGTYIRTLVDDIGSFLGCGAVLTSLRRTMTAGFYVEDCTTLSELETDPQKYLLPAQNAVWQLNDVYVSEAQAKRFVCGGELSLERLTLGQNSTDIIKVLSKEQFLGLGEIDYSKSCLKIKCIVIDRE